MSARANTSSSIWRPPRRPRRARSRPKSPTRCWPIPSSRATGSRLSEARGSGRSGGPGKARHSKGAVMRFGVVVFPGSNCDEDAFHAAHDVFGQQAEYLWHKDTDLKGADVVILPGGFAHGDYLRTGAMARFSPIMPAVRAFAEGGGPVL